MLRSILRRDLQIGNLGPPFRVPGEENLEGLKPLDQPLGIIEAIDSDDQRSTTEAFHQVLDERRAHVSACERSKLLRLDADREAADLDLPSVQGEANLVT